MKSTILKRSFSFLALIAITFNLVSCEQQRVNNDMAFVLKQKLTELAEEVDEPLISDSFLSIKSVIEAERYISTEEAQLLENMYMAFLQDTATSPANVESYLNRERTLILAWESPTDGKTSFSWLRLPKDWDPEKEYPLYVHLHGYWDVAAEPISYMSFTYTVAPSTTTAFEDGYWLSPWGRGNRWYEGISKTDVWEAIDMIEQKVQIDPSRKYISGHSMGGYGTWNLAQESSENWAAIGLHSAALFYDDADLVTEEYAEKLSNTPTYLVWGNNEDEGYHVTNGEVIRLLKEAGNQNVKDTLFVGGHDYNERDVELMYEWMRTFSND
jgi:predicted esterase